ncbi:MAG: hypothetical protein OEY36_11440, partial [Gammaproteobacteria bacterium]|nr:hypothetical protein [Gammaproteobacteria bacterium]
MKTLFSGIILSTALTLGFSSIASATSDYYYEAGPNFVRTAYMTSYNLDTDYFIFTNYQAAGNYHFYSRGTLDLIGGVWSDTYTTELALNDDNYYGTDTNFCVDAYLYYAEDIAVYVQGFNDAQEGYYDVVGSVGTCADDPNTNPYGLIYDPNTGTTYDPNAPTYDPNAPTYDPNAPTYDPNAPTYDPNAQGTVEISAVSLPVILFSLLGLAAVRLRRF